MRSVHQDQRLTFFCKDKARYFETAMTALGEEEKVYDNILEETLKALKNFETCSFDPLTLNESIPPNPLICFLAVSC